jgi:predicted unusual protein kinase regulating ubiquinone biosynthesis (AarF/ABC1/UbiB family)
LRLLCDKALGIDGDVDVQRKRGAELREHFVASKSVALIKSGQALSLRPDLIRNRYWAEELGKLVDAVGAFPDIDAMKIMRHELRDMLPRLDKTKATWQAEANARTKGRRKMNRLQKMVELDPILSLFEFYNDYRAIASASIGQVYKARIRRGKQLEAAIGPEQAAIWGGRVVAIKVQRPDVEASASLDMYLLRRTAMWLSKLRGGDLPKVADAFGMQLFGELDYIREANNCDRFRELYGYWDDIEIPAACSVLTRRRVLVLSWQDGEKGPWHGQGGIDIVRIGLRCSVDQLMTTGLFHAGRSSFYRRECRDCSH